MENLSVIVGWALTAAGLLAAGAVGLWHIATDYRETKSTAAAALKITADHEARLRAVEGAVASLAAMAANLQWIKESMENGSHN